MGDSFHCFKRIVDAHLEAEFLFLVGDREPVFDQDDARADEHALEFRHGAEEFVELFRRAEAHDALDTGAVVPGTVKQHHFARRRQMRHVALEIPLAFLALGRGGKGDHAADARIEPLGDALDGAALAGGITAFEQHNDLELLVLDPILQAHQLVLETEQLAEIKLAIDRRLGLFRHALGDQLVEPVLFHLHFQLLVEAVGNFRLDAAELVHHGSCSCFVERDRIRI